MTDYVNEHDSDELFEIEAYDYFRRRDWVVYGAFWLATGRSSQDYVDTVAAAKQKVRGTIEDKLGAAASLLGLRK